MKKSLIVKTGSSKIGITVLNAFLTECGTVLERVGTDSGASRYCCAVFRKMRYALAALLTINDGPDSFGFKNESTSLEISSSLN